MVGGCADFVASAAGVGDEPPHARHGGFHAGLPEESGAADERVGASEGAFRGGFERDAAIHAHVTLEAELFAPLAGLLDFGDGFVDERLTAEARIDRHDEEGVDVAEEGFHGAHGGGGIDREAGAEPEGADFPEDSFHARAQFHMDDELVGAGLLEGLEEDFGAGAHQVDVEEESREGADGADDGGAEGDIGNEVAVHDVEVEPVGAGARGAGDFAVESGEIGCEQGRRNEHGARMGAVGGDCQARVVCP